MKKYVEVEAAFVWRGIFLCISDKSAHGYIAANTLVSSHLSLLLRHRTTNTLEEHSVICNDVLNQLFRNDTGWEGVREMTGLFFHWLQHPFYNLLRKCLLLPLSHLKASLPPTNTGGFQPLLASAYNISPSTPAGLYPNENIKIVGGDIAP